MLSRLLTLGLLAASQALAQTPPNFTPQTSKALTATFDANSTSPAFFVNGGVFAINATQTAPQLFLPANTTFGNGTQPPTFLILMVDPDAPSPQNSSIAEILHWLQPGVRLSRSVESITDANGTELAMLSASDTATEAIAPYRGPAPPSTGPHRYVIMLFRQPRPDAFDLPESFSSYQGGANRMKFNATEFVAQAQLGSPIAATYFLVGNTTTGNGSETYTGSDAAPGIGSSSSSSGGASSTGGSSSGGSSSSSGTASGSGAAATQTGSGAEKLGVGALIGAVAGAMVLLG